MVLKASADRFNKSSYQMSYNYHSSLKTTLLSDGYIRDKKAQHIINLELHSGELFLIYHEILQTRCNITEDELLSELNWIKNYLKSIGLNLDFMVSDEALCSVYIKDNKVHKADVDFFSTVNTKLLTLEESKLIASRLSDFFITRREQHLKTLLG
jgi:hypothetical protein